MQPQCKQASIQCSFRVRDRLFKLKKKYHLRTYDDVLRKLAGIDKEDEVFECPYCFRDIESDTVRCPFCAKLIQWD